MIKSAKEQKITKHNIKAFFTICNYLGKKHEASISKDLNNLLF